MSTPPLYRLGRWLGHAAATVYFRRIEISGRGEVPPEGPVLLAANHPQSVLDALVLGVASPRTVHYVAHSGLFRDRWRAWVLRGAGVIPIHRRSDVCDHADRNRQSFEACRAVLEQGGCIGIFPEGTSQEERRVQRFKTGTARIALETEAAHDFSLGVRIVPVGLSFQSARRFRSRVLVHFDAPIDVDAWRERYRSDPESAVRALTEELQVRVRHSVVDISHPELEELVEQIEEVYKGELLEREGLKVPGASRFERDQALSREIARAAEFFAAARPELILQLRSMLADYHRRLEELQLPDRMLREEGAGFAGRSVRFAAWVTLGAPLAAWGAAFNFLPYRLSGYLAHRRRRDETKVHLAQLFWGAMVFVPVYAVYGWAAFTRWTLPVASGFLASLPLCGFVALAFARRVRAGRKRLRYAWLRSVRSWSVKEAKLTRERIIEVMDDALDEYLEHLEAREEEAT